MELKLYFSPDQMRDFLLLRGWVMQTVEEEEEINVYQNVFIPRTLLMEYYFKDNRRLLLEQAFREEMTLKLLMA